MLGLFYTMFIVLIGWTLFYFTDVNRLFAALGDMFNFGNGIISDTTLNLLLSSLPVMIVAAVASTPLAAKLYERFRHAQFMWAAESLFVAAVLFLSTASLVNQSYNPFLYFRF